MCVSFTCHKGVYNKEIAYSVSSTDLPSTETITQKHNNPALKVYYHLNSIKFSSDAGNLIDALV